MSGPEVDDLPRRDGRLLSLGDGSGRETCLLRPSNGSVRAYIMAWSLCDDDNEVSSVPAFVRNFGRVAEMSTLVFGRSPTSLLNHF